MNSDASSTRVDWSSYAAVYDLMAENNPAYQEIVGLVVAAVGAAGLPERFCAADIGAGTGNHSLAIAAAHPAASMTHLDADPAMVGVARTKAAARGLGNVAFVTAPVSGDSFEERSLDLCVSVHALYAVPEPREAIRAMHRWLRPGGVLVACDLGRPLDIGDWARYYWSQWRPRRGALRTAGLFWRGREVARQNRLIAGRQRAGAYWTHTTDEFRDALEACGFGVQSIRPCYRGYSDLAVGRRV